MIFRTTRRRVFFLITVFYAFLNSTAFCENLYYRSNSFGMLHERVEEQNIADLEYVMVIDRDSDSQISRLLAEGREIKRWERIYTGSGTLLEEKEFSEDRLKARRVFGGNGLLQEEILFEDGQPSRRTIYSYCNRKLSVLEVFGGDGVSIYRENYTYTRTGLLREVVRTFPGGECEISSYNFGDGQLFEEMFKGQTDLIISRYNANGKLQSLNSWRDGESVSMKTWEYYPDGILHRLIEDDLEEGKKLIKQFDPQGRIAEERTEGPVPEQVTYERNQEGLLIREVRTHPTGREEWVYRYDQTGELTGSTLFMRGEIEKTRTYIDDDHWFEEIYREGEVILRIHYYAEEKVREEFIRDGRVISERVFGRE